MWDVLPSCSLGVTSNDWGWWGCHYLSPKTNWFMLNKCKENPHRTITNNNKKTFFLHTHAKKRKENLASWKQNATFNASLFVLFYQKIYDFLVFPNDMVEITNKAAACINTTWPHKPAPTNLQHAVYSTCNQPQNWGRLCKVIWLLMSTIRSPKLPS